MRKVLTLVLVLSGLPVAAQEPKFEYGKKDENKVEWKASAQLGLILTTGNSRSTAFSGSAASSYKDGANKVSFDGNIAYARSSILIASDANMDNMISENEVQRSESTTANNWLLKLRYDRFFTEHNSFYGAGKLGADKPAGKQVFGGVQIGYSRQIYKTEDQELVGEGGYDFTYEDYVAAGVESLKIHSLRLFLGYTAKLSEVTGFLASIESLFNLNSEKAPPGHEEIKAFKDTRVNAKAALTTKVWKRIDFRFAVSMRYDNSPAPMAPFKIPFATGYFPLVEKTDLQAEGALIINFL